MASILWYAKGILLIDYHEKGQTTHRDYYANILGKLNKNIQEKRPGLAKEITFTG